MEKGNTYHRLLEQYIEQSGRNERPARSGDLSELYAQRESVAPVRATLLKPAGRGEWELWLVRGFPENPSFYLQQAGRFRNRKLGEIVADYNLRAEAETSSRNTGNALTGNDDCHLRLGSN